MEKWQLYTTNEIKPSGWLRRQLEIYFIENPFDAQKIGEHIYGKSITDPCLGWEKTERLIYDIADVL